MKKDIHKTVSYYVKKYETSDPFQIAKELNIELAIGNMGSRLGCYMYMKRHKCVFLNENLDEQEQRFVMAHELGHAILHPRQNCYFIRNKTFLSADRIEIEANTFAIELLVPDTEIIENSNLTLGQLARLTGYSEDILRYMKIFNSNQRIYHE